MIFLQMVNGLRHYPVANAVAQTFPHPVILTKLDCLPRLQKPRPTTAATTRSGGFQTAVFKNGDWNAPLLVLLLYCSRKIIRAFVRS
ncbi:MAG: hypothetical protein DME27_06610 [Verrucomicrobia bacterium]|nr:MAG: hypothetical protein DMC57_09775 [Verrucomicrobiota bacterium]PYL43277.1 MAG: hypothetical protein DME29_07295 [Verrucomicrobiota bacterium]PYL98028.1 MAG: hypothetical protein DME27_06610 [Verrucomicrobiota bacterium]